MSSPQEGGGDLVDVLIHDHRTIEELFGELEIGDAGPDQRGRMAGAVVAELVRHTITEERYLYPTVRRVLPEGDRLADRGIHGHVEAERDMKSLEGLDAATPDFELVLTKLMAETRQHILDEEVDLFPRLRVAADPHELRELARRAQQVKRFAPTRPHPSSPSRPPASTLVEPALGLVDRIRDALSRRTT